MPRRVADACDPIRPEQQTAAFHYPTVRPARAMFSWLASDEGGKGKVLLAHRAGAEVMMHGNRPSHAKTCAAARACAATTLSGHRAIAATAPSSSSQTLPTHSDSAWPILTLCARTARRGWRGEDGEARRGRRGEAARRGRRGEDGEARGPSRWSACWLTAGHGLDYSRFWGRCQALQHGPSVLHRTETAESI